MQKLVIADHSDVRVNSISNLLQEEWEIHVCADGYTAIDTLKYLDPEALILNLNLEKKDGLTVLEECFPNVPPVTLALSTYISPYVQQIAASLGVGYIMPIPCTVEAVKKRLTDMYAAYLETPSLLIRHLHKLGINTKQDGYHYLLKAIPLFAKDRSQRLQKDIYIDVARSCGANSHQCVEHSIRIAIHAAWKKRDPAIWSFYFPEAEECPSNGEFIARLAEMI